MNPGPTEAIAVPSKAQNLLMIHAVPTPTPPQLVGDAAITVPGAFERDGFDLLAQKPSLRLGLARLLVAVVRGAVDGEQAADCPSGDFGNLILDE
jgi:hypothetical protein